MAEKIFKLMMKNGVEVSTIEELRENFDYEKVLGYFKDGTLKDWLEYRFYDDEVAAVAEIKEDDKNLMQKLCAALDVECNDDLEFSQRIKEKKILLAEKTDDETVIGKAANTAMNQEDLAILLHMDYSTIYLCGEIFNIPVRLENRRYVGVLGTPKIKIKADSESDLEGKNIVFENCQLPWQKASPLEEMKSVVENILNNKGKWHIVNSGTNIAEYKFLTPAEKSLALRMVCQKKYNEHQIAYMQLTQDLTAGFAFTGDAFCTGGLVGSYIIKYKDIRSVSVLPDYRETGAGAVITVAVADGRKFKFNGYDGKNKYAARELFKMFGKGELSAVKILEMAKNLYGVGGNVKQIESFEEPEEMNPPTAPRARVNPNRTPPPIPRAVPRPGTVPRTRR